MINRRDKEIDVLMEELKDSREFLEQINYLLMDYFEGINRFKRNLSSPEILIMFEVDRFEKRFNILMDMNKTHLINREISREDSIEIKREGVEW